MNKALDRPGAIAVTAGSAIWGLFWIPLRYLDELGMHGVWAIVLVMATATLAALIAVAWRQEWSDLRLSQPWSIGFALGLASVLYFIGVLFSDVVRVIFLFYLLPVWTTLAARLIYGEPIRPAQLPVIAAALIGVWLLLGGGSQLPLPQNIGDYCGLAAGMCWGISLALLRGRPIAGPAASSVAALGSGFMLALVVAIALSLLTDNPSLALPDETALQVGLPAAILFGSVVLFPAMFGQIWGARRIPAPTAALLTMAEIIVATISAGLLIGTELGPVSMIGGAVIVLAVCIDLVVQQRSAINSPTPTAG